MPPVPHRTAGRTIPGTIGRAISGRGRPRSAGTTAPTAASGGRGAWRDPMASGRSSASGQRSSGVTAAWARSMNGAGITPSTMTPASATASASPPAKEVADGGGAASGSRMYM